jgi:hypothetical protein
MKDQTEVCPLARGVMFLQEGNPYPNDYGSAFASSVLLYPQHYQSSLRSAFPTGALRAYQVPLVSPNREGSLYSPVMLGVHVTEHLTP